MQFIKDTNKYLITKVRNVLRKASLKNFIEGFAALLLYSDKLCCNFYVTWSFKPINFRLGLVLRVKYIVVPLISTEDVPVDKNIKTSTFFGYSA